MAAETGAKLFDYHAWLAGGMDTTELESSFSGMQQAQELTQRQLGRVQAGLGRKQ